MNKANSAAELLKLRKVNCAQAVLTSFCEELGLDRDLALKVTKCFGGGIAGSGKTCGAVTGAYMVMGLRQPASSEEPGKEKVQKLIKEFNEKFIALNGSLECRSLLGYDVSQPAELEAVKTKGLFVTTCPKFVKDSIEILENSA